MLYSKSICVFQKMNCIAIVCLLHIRGQHQTSFSSSIGILRKKLDAYSFSAIYLPFLDTLVNLRFISSEHFLYTSVLYINNMSIFLYLRFGRRYKTACNNTLCKILAVLILCLEYKHSKRYGV